MRSGLFSPSLELRTEPPYSLGTVLAVTKDPKGRVRYASVQFKGRAIRCRSLHINLAVGEQVAVIEVPRGTFWTRRTGPSWYVKPLSDWTKAGRPAQVAMEYFLKDCRKFWPFVALPKDPEDETDPEDTLALWEKKSKDGTDGRPKQRVGQEDFHERDKDGNGVITRDEWRPTDGDFDDVDNDGDGEITVEEWKKWKDSIGDPVPPETPSVWITCTPSTLSSAGDITLEWGSIGETSVTVTGTNGESWSGTSGTVTVSIGATSIFTATGTSGAQAIASCFVGVTGRPEWWVFHNYPSPLRIALAVNGYTNLDRARYEVYPEFFDSLPFRSFLDLPELNFLPKLSTAGILYSGPGAIQGLAFDGASEPTGAVGDELPPTSSFTSAEAGRWQGKYLIFQNGDSDPVRVEAIPSVQVYSIPMGFTVISLFPLIDV